MKDGEINEGTVADYNAHYKTSYTVEEAEEKFGHTTPIEDIAQTIADEANDTMMSSYSISDVVVANGDGTYTVKPESIDYVIEKILKDNTITESSKFRLLELFNITEDMVMDVVNDPHYR
jgi:hypothetical protein